MVEKLEPIKEFDCSDTPQANMQHHRYHNDCINKINEIIDWINDVSALRVIDKQVTANMPNIDVGELTFLSKENSDLKDELECTRKALDVAVDGLEKMTWGCDSSDVEHLLKEIKQITESRPENV